MVAEVEKVLHVHHVTGVVFVLPSESFQDFQLHQGLVVKSEGRGREGGKWGQKTPRCHVVPGQVACFLRTPSSITPTGSSRRQRALTAPSRGLREREKEGKVGEGQAKGQSQEHWLYEGTRVYGLCHPLSHTSSGS